MRELEDRSIHCPYCGEPIEVFVDCSVDDQRYIEDCQVCCRPINFSVTVEPGGEIRLLATRDDD